jgi:hypothetical protein
MLVGCASGLLEDYWIEPRLFGINGLVKTVLGWALGGIGARFDLNTFWGCMASGASVHLLDELLQAALRRLFGEAVMPIGAAALGIRAVAGGLLTAAVLAIRGVGTTPRRAAEATKGVTVDYRERWELKEYQSEQRLAGARRSMR